MFYALQRRFTRGTEHRLALAKTQVKAETLASRMKAVQPNPDAEPLSSSSTTASIADPGAPHSATAPGVSFVGPHPDPLCSSTTTRTTLVSPLPRLSLPDAPRPAKRAHEDDADDDERCPKKRLVREDSNVDNPPDEVDGNAPDEVDGNAPDEVDDHELSADDKAVDSTHNGFGVFEDIVPSVMGNALKDLPLVSLTAKHAETTGLTMVFEDEKKNRAEFTKCHLSAFEELAVLGILVDLLDITIHESLLFDQVDAIPQPLLLRARQLRIILNAVDNDTPKSMLQWWYGPLLDMPNLERVVLQSAEPDVEISLPWKRAVHLLGTVIKHDPRRTRVERQGVFVLGSSKHHVQHVLQKVAIWPDLLPGAA
ncbi:hypothetical protein EXIGLDRAFT_747736 [Exidia glandulosa HHB12029]|uniref:Uncharacterized protein n=1 Tax=Exidia glandulosa HHB12029 TaxID=1314781 RepID=A0A165KFN0_EXIGL|nr:hypothetical protein EXIGLDRAFT_747736 [Exidia glandulosa HHB12029]